jgi:hypothetical protein
MSESVAKVIAKVGSEDLRLALHAAEGARVDYAIAVTLKVVAVGMTGLGKLPAAQVSGV